MKKILCLIFLCLTIKLSFGEANYVYHETTTNTIGTGSLQFRDIITPNQTQSVKIGFKIEWQFYWTDAVIYYTTDGSNPSGYFGVGVGTTQVINAIFDHNFGDPVVDAVFGVIPPQPAGTTVKYIVSAWHSGGGDEIFGNGCGNAPNPFCGVEKRPSSEATVFSYTVYNGVLDLKENINLIEVTRKVSDKIFLDGTVLKTDIGNKKYNQNIIIYDDLGRIVYKTKRFITGYSEYNLNNFIKSGFNIIRIFVDDKLYRNFTFKIIKN